MIVFGEFVLNAVVVFVGCKIFMMASKMAAVNAYIPHLPKMPIIILSVGRVQLQETCSGWVQLLEIDAVWAKPVNVL